MTTLNDALTQIALAGNLSINDLIKYAHDDPHGGRDTGQFQAMSIFADEGRVLYALVRALKPTRCVEVGVADGASATHILAALAENDIGHLISYDIQAGVGFAVPEVLRARWTLNIVDALTADLPEQADFIFEDGDHSYEFTRDVLIRLKALNPRVILSHDYFTHEVYGGFFVKQGFDEVLHGAAGVKIEGAFTGLGYWFNDDYGQWREVVENEVFIEAGIIYPDNQAVIDKLLVRSPDFSEQPTVVISDGDTVVRTVHETNGEVTKPLARKARRKAAK